MSGRALGRARPAPLALVPAGEPRPATPAPEERRQVYRRLLRQGDPPVGWVTGQAALWGIGHATVSAELAAAREALAEERTPAGAIARAHELVEQAAELAALIERAACHRGGSPAGLSVRLRGLKAAAEVKLRAAAELRALARDEPLDVGNPHEALNRAMREARLPR